MYEALGPRGLRAPIRRNPALLALEGLAGKGPYVPLMRTRFVWTFLLVGIAACAPTAQQKTVPTPPPPPLQEHIPATEAADTKALIQLFSGNVRAAYAHGERPALRDVHPKGHGCVKARFTVLSGLAPQFRYGVFAEPRSYSAVIRFSNGSPVPQSDTIGDGRGMAIKVMGVAGRKLVPGEKFTQDFVMINHPVFFSPNARDYLALNRALFGGNKAAFFKAHPLDGKIINAISAHVTQDLFAETFFSMSAYTIGPRYMKFRALPVRCPQGAALPSYSGALPNDPNYLRARMARDLRTANACYQLQVQLQTDAAAQPVEDPRVEWQASQAPFKTLADIVIPKQSFESAAQQTYCENLSFTPWHGSVDLRPAGGINRIRLAVYEASTQLRHSLNHVSAKEPQ